LGTHLKSAFAGEPRNFAFRFVSWGNRNPEGKQPFTGNTSAMIFTAILTQAPTPPVRLNPKLSPKVEEIINKALEKDRETRYQTASDLRADLNRLEMAGDAHFRHRNWGC
jgi:serine/threonine protein kinase